MLLQAEEGKTNPNDLLSLKVPYSGISAANLYISRLLDKTSGDSSYGECSVTGTRGSYTVFTPAQKYEVGKRTAEIRTTAAMHYYASIIRIFQRSFKEILVQWFKDMYKDIDELKKSIHSSTFESLLAVKELVPKKRGRPLLELYDQVKEYIRELRREGVVINSDIVIAVGTRIVMNNDVNVLLANDGHIDLTKNWAKYLLSRMGFVKWRANTKAKISVEHVHFDELKKFYLLEINNVIEMDEILYELVINWDQTGINYIPISSWTIAEEESIVREWK